MLRRFLSFLGLLTGVFVITFGILRPAPSIATQLPSACVYVSADVASTSSTTIIHDTDGTTCPSMPETQPCDSGIWERVHPTVTSVVDSVVFVCVQGVL